MSGISPIEQSRRDLEKRFAAMSPQEAAKAALETARTSPAGFRVFILSAALSAISQSERERRLEEALKPFAMFALEGKRGGEFIICKGLFADMKSWDDSPPRECHLHKDDFLRARSALNPSPEGSGNG